MIVDLPDTTTGELSKRLVRMRSEVGAMALSRVLTLLVVVEDVDAEAAIDLTICGVCECPFVQPVDWDEAGPRHWKLELRCPNCEAHGTVVVGDEVVDHYDLVLERGSAELARSLQLVARLRSRPRFPGPTEWTSYVDALAGTGLRKVEDARERYHVEVGSRVEALEVIDALYLPGASPRRKQAAVDWLAGRIERRGPVRMSIGMRRFVVIKALHAPPESPDAPAGE